MARDLESYFDVLTPDDIRLGGTRIGIETVLAAYLEGCSPEEIVLDYPSLSLEQVHATITYYFANQAEVDAYLRRHREFSDEMRRRQEENPPEAVRRLRALRARLRRV
jgi:uncharacterized protein (DUF433 family)